MNLACGCCEMPFTRAGYLRLRRGTLAHGDGKDWGVMGGVHAAPWQLVGSKP